MSEFLDAFAAYVRANDLPVFRIAEAVGEGEPEAVTIRPCGASLNGYSVAKAFVVTAIGLLADEGKLRVEERVTDILGERPGMDPRWRDVTVDMALTHRLGLPQNCLDIDCQDARLFGRDYLSYVFSVSLEQNPGEERVYTDAAYYLLARIAEEKAGMPADVYLWERLLYDLGFAELKQLLHCCVIRVFLIKILDSFINRLDRSEPLNSCLELFQSFLTQILVKLNLLLLINCSRRIT